MLQSFHLALSLFRRCRHNTRLKPTHVLIHRPPVDGANEALREKLHQQKNLSSSALLL